MSYPVTVTDDDAARSLRHKHKKSSPPHLMAFPGFSPGNGPGANGPSTPGPSHCTGDGAPSTGSPDSGGVAYGDGQG